MLGSFLAVFIGKEMWDGVQRKDLPLEQRRATNQSFVRFLGWFFLGLLALGVFGGLAQSAFGQTSTFRDASGRVTGYATTNNAGTVYSNSLGQNTGRSTTNNTGTTFYNSRGQQTGRISK